ncbi:putative bifunctional diguanylate cyclase/phosphodiesterase [Devosia sp.]|uniref:putative bifunctional diguanylate cyclase/phosphodiesterase n=1 Tax=Devosia sp. TaxID=1871048 RepID=UPI003A8E01AB
MYGKGLRSIRTRFAIMIGGACLIGIWATIGITLGLGITSPAAMIALTVVGVAGPVWLTLRKAGQLTSSIDGLRESTNAIVEGSFDRPVEIDCSCEVGGLQDSFAKMVKRLNANILRMNTLAYSDPLTGLSNRSVVTHMLEMALKGGDQAGWQGALFFIDLDGLKAVNDSLGHDAGDELIRQVAHRIVHEGLDRTFETLDSCATAFGELCQRPPENIVFARFAGDEFVAILPGAASPEDLAVQASAILDAMRHPFPIDGHYVFMSASIGIAQAPVDTSSPAELLSFADIAMYQAKQSGKAQFAFFDEDARRQLIEQSELEQDLRVALREKQFTLHYQPKIHAQSLEIQGVEALVRWNHPRRGMVRPDQFIALAENAGLICDLGHEVMRLAILQAKAWADAGTPYRIAVNVSPTQFRRLDFVTQLTAMFDAAGVEPGLIEIEVTESVAMDDYAIASRKIEALRQIGVRTSIDDFGIGHSNLNQLVNLPFDSLKIDISLIAQIGQSEKSEAVVTALIGIAVALGHTTVAEGIETLEQYEFLLRHGCNTIQGYYFARPMAADAFEQWVEARAANTVIEAQRGDLLRSFAAQRS